MKLDIIGDIHGCYDEFVKLTNKLQYSWENKYPIHPQKRKLVFLGDITDRGPNSIKMIEIVHKLVIEKQLAYYVPGNHCNKLYRYFLGNKVQVKHGLETTVAEFNSLNSVKQQLIKRMFIELYENAPLYKILDKGKLVVAHAGIREDYIGVNNKAVESFVLYGDITGKKHPDGSPVRLDWAKQYNGESVIVYGHTPVKKARKVNNTFNIDTGAVFGGLLTALRYPELIIVSVPSTMPYIQDKFTSFN